MRIGPCLNRLRGTGLTAEALSCRSRLLFISPRRTFACSPRSTKEVDIAVKPYYVTTPIFYVNAAPHIGHLHSILLTDVLARYARLRFPDRPVRFATGTDEHGLKIQQVAKGLGRDPADLCDEISQRFRALAKAADASHTNFIRTTFPEHKIAVQHLWKVLEEKGHIYKGSHSGWYAVSDECFYPESQIEDRVDEKTGETIKVSTESGSVVEWTEEENYKFRLSGMQQALIDWLESSPTCKLALKPYTPPSTRTYLLKSLQSEPLQDLSISRPRSRLTWGIPVPGDEDHTIYVWVDALTNYLTVLGYPWLEEAKTMDVGLLQKKYGWPVDAHIVGKDIVRFHAIYWPAMLIAAGLHPPTQVLAHAHWTMNKTKMSKSRGNVADPFQAMEKYGVDPVRWYLMRAGGSLSTDADYSADELDKNYKILAAQMGNLAARIASPKLQKRFLDSLKSDKIALDGEVDAQPIIKMLGELKGQMEERLDGLDFCRALEGVMELIAEANRLFTLFEPWKSTTPPPRLLSSMTLAHESLRLSAIAITPIMPTKSSELLDRLGVPEGERSWEGLRWESIGAVERVGRGVGELVRRQGEGKGKGKKGEVLFPDIKQLAESA